MSTIKYKYFYKNFLLASWLFIYYKLWNVLTNVSHFSKIERLKKNLLSLALASCIFARTNCKEKFWLFASWSRLCLYRWVHSRWLREPCRLRANQSKHIVREKEAQCRSGKESAGRALSHIAPVGIENPRRNGPTPLSPSPTPFLPFHLCPGV